MSLMSERRGARRYDLSLPVMIRIPAHGFAETQSGRTRDISTRGLYFVIDQDVRAGSELDIMLTLRPRGRSSASSRGSKTAMRVKASPPSSNATTSCMGRRPLSFPLRQWFLSVCRAEIPFKRRAATGSGILPCGTFFL
ncbi:MAG: hypothetical protein DMG34_19845 [Acidobacteria bacterium]|nr:MAG: hypothetical protein DMG34_19845 [Acidobacteriota bacterium]